MLNIESNTEHYLQKKISIDLISCHILDTFVTLESFQLLAEKKIQDRGGGGLNHNVKKRLLKKPKKPQNL